MSASGPSGPLVSFICMFHLFMKFRHLQDYSSQPCFFFFFLRIWDTHTPVSESKDDEIK